MSCCHCGGCGCTYCVTLPDNPVVGYSMENVNLTGIGVYDATEGTTFQMRGVASATAALTVTLDAGNNVVLLTLDIPSIIDDLPTATTVQRGVGETATDAEAIAKAAVDKFLTPSNLAALGASLTFAGLVELATNAETQAGVSAVLAVTPAGLASVIVTLEQTTTWADAVARAAADPDFAGQIGVQLDVDVVYISTGAAVGDFTRPLLTFGSTNTISGFTTTVITDIATVLTFTGAGEVHFNGPNVLFSGGIMELGASSAQALNLADVSLLIAGATVPAASVLVTAGLGVPSSLLIAQFLSDVNTQTGYTAFANGVVRRTCDTTTVTLPELAQLVGTLIEDLKAVQLPSV